MGAEDAKKTEEEGGRPRGCLVVGQSRRRRRA